MSYLAGKLDAVTPLRVIRGDATSPQAAGPEIVAHICNDLGGWGRGFVLAVSRRWPETPRIGCGLAGGRWDRIEPLVTAALCEHDVAVTVYDVD